MCFGRQNVQFRTFYITLSSSEIYQKPFKWYKKINEFNSHLKSNFQDIWNFENLCFFNLINEHTQIDEYKYSFDEILFGSIVSIHSIEINFNRELKPSYITRRRNIFQYCSFLCIYDNV